LFPDVFYYLSQSLSPQRRSQLSRVLDINGAVPVPLTDSHPAFYSPHPSMLFSGVVATSCALSSSDNDVLSAGITSLGGQWRTALTKDVTHVFALSSGGAKEGTGMKVVLPHWFDDVVRLGVRGLDTGMYEWPEPGLFKAFGSVRKTKPLSEEKKALYDTALGDPASGDLPSPLSTSTSTNALWKDRKIVLGSSLELNPSQRKAHKADIEREGGQVLEFESEEEELAMIEEADVYVTRFRSGRGFVKAYRLNKTIGTLPWLWYVRATGTLTRPVDQLLHYPIPKRPIEGFARHIITVTNYTGKDREYIKKLITTMGAEFTASMSGKNTVVVAAFQSGTKTTKATSWHIPIVNHLWLEDCFVHWRDLDPASSERYVVFPPAVDFGSVIAEERGLGTVNGGQGVGGGKVYEEWELERMEREGEDEEAFEEEMEKPRRGILKNASALSVRSAEEVEHVVASSSFRGAAERDRDVFMSSVGGGMGEVSLGGYQDIDDRMDIEEEKEGKKVGEEEPVTLVKRGRGRPRKNSVSSVGSRGGRGGTPARRSATPARRSGTPARRGSTPARKVRPELPLSRPFTDHCCTLARPSTLLEQRERREPERNDESDGDGEGQGSVIKTYRARSRSQSRTRGATPGRGGKSPAPGSGVKGRKGKGMAIQSSDEEDDEDEEEEEEVVKTKEKTPAKTYAKTYARRKVPTVPTDTEGEAEAEASEAERGRKRGRGRPRKVKAPAATDDEQETVEEKKGKQIRTPGREVSVVLPTLKQVRSASRSRSRVRARVGGDEEEMDVAEDNEGKGEKKAEKTSKEVVEKTSKEVEKIEPVSAPKKRGRPRKKPLEEPAPAPAVVRSAVSASEPAQEPEAKPKSKAKAKVEVMPPPPPPASTTTKAKSKVPEKEKEKETKKEKAGPRKAIPAAHETPEPQPQAGSSNEHEETPARTSHEETPARTSSKRSAATKATRRLHEEVMPDLVNFQRELKSGSVRAAVDVTVTPQRGSVEGDGKGRKRTSVEGEEEREEREKKRAKGEGGGVVKKGRKSEGLPAKAKYVYHSPSSTILLTHSPLPSSSTDATSNPIVMTTQVTLSDDLTKAFTKLGGKFTTKPAECTHLVARSIVRTEKFLCAMAVAEYVVGVGWVEMCVERGRILRTSLCHSPLSFISPFVSLRLIQRQTPTP
ncbi:hypothetical protein BC629DRAFT_1480149, partial [Irpex lacteus]